MGAAPEPGSFDKTADEETRRDAPIALERMLRVV